MSITVKVVRAFPGGTFQQEYEGKPDGDNRVHVRLLIERMQDEIDRDGEPLRVYIAKNGVPIEAAYGLNKARD